VGCADYRIYCDGDTDGDGNRILHRVLTSHSPCLNKAGAFCNEFQTPYIRGEKSDSSQKNSKNLVHC